MNTKVCSKCREVKTLNGFSKRKASKDGYSPKCKACVKEYDAKCYAANPEKEKGYQAEYRAAYPEKIKEYRVANIEKSKEQQAEYRAANSEKEKERQAEYRAANPEKCRARNSNRRAAKLKALPKWLTKAEYKAMEAIGKEAKRLTKETGIKYEVDHIHPLKSKLICGLQCPSNLQILTMTENRAKSNKFTPYVEN